MVEKTEIPHKTPEKLHQSETLLQILVPVLVISALCLGFFLVLIIGSASQADSTGQWAQISTAFILLPLLGLGVIGLVILIFLGRLFSKWNVNLPPLLALVRIKIIEFNHKVENAAQKTAHPMIRIKGSIAGAKSILKK